MTNEEMQTVMEFILKMDRQNTAKLNRLGVRIESMPVARNRSEKRWERTEERIRALLVRAKIQERRILARARRVPPLRKTATDRRLKSLANLVERQVREGRNGKP